MALTLDGDNGISGINGSASTPAVQGTDTNTGLTFGTDTVGVVTGGSTRATVDSSGNLGLGSTSPSSLLHLEGSAPKVSLKHTATGSQGALRWLDSTGTVKSQIASYANVADSGNIEFCTNGTGTDMVLDSSGRLGIGTTSPGSFNGDMDDLVVGSGSGSKGITIYSGTSSTGSINFHDTANTSLSGMLRYDHSNNAMSFWTGGVTERMRITSGGDLYFGATVSTKTTDGFRVENSGIPNVARGSSGTFMQFFHSGNGSQIGSITNQSGASTTYNTTSDYRLKENVVDLDGAIDRVKQLLPKRFNFLVNPGTTVDGFLAHEAQAVVPEAVVGTHNEVEVWKEGDELPDGVSVGDNKLDEDGNTIPVYQGIDQSKLVPLLTAALQEAIGKIEALETRVAQLEGGAA